MVRRHHRHKSARASSKTERERAEESRRGVMRESPIPGVVRGEIRGQSAYPFVPDGGWLRPVPIRDRAQVTNLWPEDLPAAGGET